MFGREGEGISLGNGIITWILQIDMKKNEVALAFFLVGREHVLLLQQNNIVFSSSSGQCLA